MAEALFSAETHNHTKTGKTGRPKSGKETFSVRLSAEIKEQLDKAIDETSRGFSDYIELALKDRFKKDGIQ